MDINSRLQYQHNWAIRTGEPPATLTLMSAAVASSTSVVERMSGFRPLAAREEISTRLRARGTPGVNVAVYELSYVLAQLGVQYPVLRRIEASGNSQLDLSLGPATLHIFPDRVTIDGDVVEAFRMLSGLRQVSFEREDSDEESARFEDLG